MYCKFICIYIYTLIYIYIYYIFTYLFINIYIQVHVITRTPTHVSFRSKPLDGRLMSFSAQRAVRLGSGGNAGALGAPTIPLYACLGFRV